MLLWGKLREQLREQQTEYLLLEIAGQRQYKRDPAEIMAPALLIHSDPTVLTISMLAASFDKNRALILGNLPGLLMNCIHLRGYRSETPAERISQQRDRTPSNVLPLYGDYIELMMGA